VSPTSPMWNGNFVMISLAGLGEVTGECCAWRRARGIRGTGLRGRSLLAADLGAGGQDQDGTRDDHTTPPDPVTHVLRRKLYSHIGEIQRAKNSDHPI